MIIDIPAGESRYVTAPPLSQVPITVQIEDPQGSGNWKNYGAIKYSGHVVRLYGAATYRFSIGATGPNCCVIYTETDVVDATPEINVKPTGSAPTTTTAP